MLTTPTSAMNAGDLEPYLERLAELHPEVCPRQVLGVRMGLLAGERLGLELPRRDKRLVIFVETDGCFADGVSVATGCWLGRRTLRLVDHGKVAATFVDTLAERAIRIAPHPQARARATAHAPRARSRWHAYLEAYQVMPAAELLRADWVSLRLSMAAVVGRAGARVECERCGEEVLNGREVARQGQWVCPGCAGDAYYAPGTVGVTDSSG